MCSVNLHTVEVKQVDAINREDVKEKGVPLALFVKLFPYFLAFKLLDVCSRDHMKFKNVLGSKIKVDSNYVLK